MTEERKEPMSKQGLLVQNLLECLDQLTEIAEAIPLADLLRLEEEMSDACKSTVCEVIARKQVHRVVEGYAVDPMLPPGFSNCPNEERPASHRFWWCRPYIVTHQHGEHPTYWVECLDGGAWDRPTWWGEATTLEAAVDICRNGPNWNKPQ